VGRPTGFARSKEGTTYALVQDGTNKTAAEIYEMDRYDRMLTAAIRAQYYREQNKGSGGPNQNIRPQ